MVTKTHEHFVSAPL